MIGERPQPHDGSLSAYSEYSHRADTSNRKRRDGRESPLIAAVDPIRYDVYDFYLSRGYQEDLRPPRRGPNRSQRMTKRDDICRERAVQNSSPMSSQYHPTAECRAIRC